MARIAPLPRAGHGRDRRGSTKSDVVAAARTAFGDKIGQFVPAHPIAGAENSGAAAAKADLYRERKVVLTALPENSVLNVARVRSAWEWCGAQIFELTPAEHDQVFAAVSHLPHLLSFALVHDLPSVTTASCSSPSLRPVFATSRALPRVTRKCGDIALANREALLIELKRYEDQIDEMRAALEANDGQRLEEIFDTARTARRAWQESQK